MLKYKHPFFLLKFTASEKSMGTCTKSMPIPFLFKLMLTSI